MAEEVDNEPKVSPTGEAPNTDFRIGPYVYKSEKRDNEKDIISDRQTKISWKNNNDFKFQDKFNDLAFRILLIDDKIGHADTNNKYKDISDENLEIEIKKCKCTECQSTKTCKLGAIKFLMDKDRISKDNSLNNKIGDLKEHFYWKDKEIDTYYCPTILKDFISDETSLPQDEEGNNKTEINLYPDGDESKHKDENSILNIKCSFEPRIFDEEDKTLHVQIIGVRDVRTALLLMSKYKFDIIFCDYLLDQKEDQNVDQNATNSDKYDFSIQLFEFLLKNHQNELLKQLCRDVLDNRGPLGKYWIMPITEFNEEFIKALDKHHINLIDYRWNINKSADPITTPKDFLYHLNRFIELQLRSCVFTMDRLLTFLLYTCQDLKALEAPEVKFDDFQSFMGSEYATLMQRYGNRLPIKRDAQIEIGKTNTYKSVFATYIWHKFYADNNFANEIELYRLMHRFYHQAAVMYNDRNGCQRLNEAFEHLCFFIYTNRAVQQELEKEEEPGKNNKKNNKLMELMGYLKPQDKQEQTENKGLPYLKEIIEKYTRYGIEELINNK